MERLFAAWSRMLERLFPDPFTLSLLLTLATLMVALLLTPFGLSELIGFWGDGLWSFLGFAMQMGLILVTGQALAEATLVARALRKIASAPKNMGQAAGLVSFCAIDLVSGQAVIQAGSIQLGIQAGRQNCGMAQCYWRRRTWTSLLTSRA